MKWTLRFLALCACIQAVVVLSGCGAKVVVQWPDLKRLDDLAEKCEALCDLKNVQGLREVAGTVKETALTVASDPLPAGTKSPVEVKTLQADLKTLANAIHDPAAQNGAELTDLLAGAHPIVEKLMEASGIPHVHENEKNEAKPAKAEKP